MPYSVEDCIPITATKTGLFAVDVFIDSPTVPNDTSHWIGLELLKSSVGADYQTTGILVILHYNGTIEVLGGTTGIDVAKIDTDWIPVTSTTFTTHWGGTMTKVTIHVVGNEVKVYVDNSLTLSFITSQVGGFHSLAKYGNVNAFFDTFIMRSYIEPNPDQTTWGAEEIRAKRVTYSVDTDFKAYGVLKTENIDVYLERLGVIKSYSVDVEFFGTATVQRNIDVYFSRKNITNPEQVDAYLERLGVIKPYLLDTDFKLNNASKLYSIDVDLKVTSTKPYSADVYIRLTKPLSYQIDAILKELDIPKSYFVDAVFKRLGISLQYIADTILKRKDIPHTYTIDAIEKLFGITKPYSLDTLLKRLDIPVSYSVDAILKRRNIPVSYLIDAILKAVLSINYSIDTNLIAKEQIGYAIDVILISAIISLIGGGHPEEIDEPKIFVEYIDRDFEIPINSLQIISVRQEQKIQNRELQVMSSQIDNYIFYSGLNIIMGKAYFVFAMPLTILRGYSPSFFIAELQTIGESYKKILSQELRVVVGRGKEISVSPLEIIGDKDFSIFVPALNVVSEKSYSTSTMPLSTRKKKMTKEELMGLLGKLDELD